MAEQKPAGAASFDIPISERHGTGRIEGAAIVSHGRDEWQDSAKSAVTHGACRMYHPHWRPSMPGFALFASGPRSAPRIPSLPGNGAYQASGHMRDILSIRWVA